MKNIETFFRQIRTIFVARLFLPSGVFGYRPCFSGVPTGFSPNGKRGEIFMCWTMSLFDTVFLPRPSQNSFLVRRKNISGVFHELVFHARQGYFWVEYPQAFLFLCFWVPAIFHARTGSKGYFYNRIIFRPRQLEYFSGWIAWKTFSQLPAGGNDFLMVASFLNKQHHERSLFVTVAGFLNSFLVGQPARLFADGEVCNIFVVENWIFMNHEIDNFLKDRKWTDFWKWIRFLRLI